MKSAAGAASRTTKSRGARSREAPRPAVVRMLTRRPGASLDLGPLDLVFLEAALAADLITASISKTSRRVLNFSKTTKSRITRQIRVLEKSLGRAPGPRDAETV